MENKPQNLINTFENKKVADHKSNSQLETIEEKLKISKKEEERAILEKKYSEEVIHRSFTNIREILESFLNIMTKEGVVDYKKLQEKERTFSDIGEYIKFLSLAKEDPTYKIARPMEKVLDDINKEIEYLTKNGFLGISVNEKNLDQILSSGVYRGDEYAWRRPVEKSLGFSNLENNGSITYGSFIDDRNLKGAKTHGGIIFRLNSLMISKAVFLIGDSLSGDYPDFLLRQKEKINSIDPKQRQIDFALKRQILPEHIFLAKALLNLEKKYDEFSFYSNYPSDKSYLERSYVESQILGNVDIVSDVNEIILNDSSFKRMGKEAKQKLEQEFKDKILITRDM